MTTTDVETLRICQMGENADGPRIVAWSLLTNEIYIPVPDDVAQWADDDGEEVMDSDAVLALTGGEQMVRTIWLSEKTRPNQDSARALRSIVNAIQNMIDAQKS
jgi:hypothetical protein